MTRPQWRTDILMSDAGSHMRRVSLDCDVIVVGGGPAGSTAAARLARAGRSVMLFERDQFPRFHIGESLLASVNDVLGAIGADDLIRQAGFPHKWGATFLSADGLIERFADFAAAPDVITARALLPFKPLINNSFPLLSRGALGLFPKGQDVAVELTEAAKYWNIDYNLVPSRTDSLARIVVVRGLDRR